MFTGWKTIIFNLVGALLAYFGLPADFITPEQMEQVLTGVLIVGNIILRFTSRGDAAPQVQRALGTETKP